jgi:hypothetical protein
MTTVQLSLTSEESKWLSDWSTLSGYKTSSEGIREVLKVCGAIPKGSSHWQERFEFAE